MAIEVVRRHVALARNLYSQLAKRGVNPREQVKTAAGIADMVTDTAVYTVLGSVTAERLRNAADHVLACRDALNPKLRAVMYLTVAKLEGEAARAAAEAKARGVTINLWRDGDHIGMH